MSVTHEMAVQRLREADKVAGFRNVDGTLGGWDGYVRRNFNKKIVGIVWPDEAAK